ncbi:hypothetical protein A3B32_01985 [Candidatus Uhrbacteria bacterium RIFCSPLOWO2_01_FULL_53_9]|uniref:Uncharacterized protein n=3 Tax=Candidatus Uhriibacteriota TaxID=1752732 RepID=A0A1F7UY74_9BACT|nr:MAG: hypothetical protein A3C17_00455 [Candidatus Uhrbacteria bacterium RIFCSPHIGHO2_02_FULL_53_13]OGL83223.1 MAG: hypothetical protein A3B32_01985 [Candidatus Uhrbacteria bacterium RIFCSPLOWO2_01_FULL_53_9]OGL88767.1 MAG: hypothetical protein A3I45_04315 [Candidatus Uhrbacteria bacterium RIFCSPLOWO2_02_FULL_53_10]
MFAQVGTLIFILSLLWFLVYWIFGGVVFMIIGLVRPGRMKRVRFSCLYTIVSALTGYGAARLGVYWATQASGSLPKTASIEDVAFLLGSLEFIGILLGLAVGFAVTFVTGWIIMLLSRNQESTWYDRGQEPVDEPPSR